MTDTPRTKDAFDALKRRACGTEYVKAKMEQMERELSEAASALIQIAELTERQQLPITAEIYGIAKTTLATTHAKA